MIDQWRIMRLVRLFQIVRQIFSVIFHLTFKKESLGLSECETSRASSCKFLSIFQNLYIIRDVFLLKVQKFCLFIVCVCACIPVCQHAWVSVHTHIRGEAQRTLCKINFKRYNNVVTTITIINIVTHKFQ